MKPCSECGAPNAYIGLVTVECARRGCARYSAKWAALVRPRTGDVTLPPPIGTHQQPSLPYRSPASVPTATIRQRAEALRDPKPRPYSTTHLHVEMPRDVPIVGRKRGPRTCLCGMFLIQYNGSWNLSVVAHQPMDLDAIALVGAGPRDILSGAYNSRGYEPMLPTGGGMGGQAMNSRGFPAAIASVEHPVGLRRVFTVEAGDTVGVQVEARDTLNGREDLSVVFYGYELS